MPDDMDGLLARLATALVGDPPQAPTFDELPHGATRRGGRAPHPRRAAVVIAVAFVVVAVVIAVLVSMGSSDREEPAGPTGFVPCTISDPGFFIGPDGQTFGPALNQHPETGGTVDTAALPDYIPVTCTTGTNIGGWIKKTDMLTSPTPASPDQVANTPPDIDPVYADDGTTLVGHMYPGRGFVPLGTDPEPATTVPTLIQTAP